MVRRVNLSQLKSQLRQLENKQRQAISNYNQAARNFKQAVNNYNSAARAHNARVRSNQQRLANELSRLRAQPTTGRFVRYSTSVQSVQTTFRRVEATAERGGWSDQGLLDLAEGEAANSAAVLNALLDNSSGVDEGDPLPDTVLTNELIEIDPDLDSRWRGALFSLSPRNPDAARHFCTSAREILASILTERAPDSLVRDALPGFAPTPQGGVSRRARIHYLLQRSGNDVDGLAEFVDEDVDSVIALFGEFNGGTHGPTGQISFSQLRALKSRVEGAIQFLHRIVTPR